MQNDWHSFLTTQGATTGSDGTLLFGDTRKEIAALASTPQIISLDHFGVIRATGEDVRTFLQGQLTNDINLLDAHCFQLSGYCNPKGRLLALFTVIPDGENLLLLLPKALLEPTLKRLRMFILRSKADLIDASNDYVCLGYAGQNVIDILAGKFAELPQNEYELTRTDNTLLGKMPGTPARFIAVSPTADAIAHWEQRNQQLIPASSNSWHWLDIQAGIPGIWPETMEEFVPQTVNLELIRGVNFKKGCYTGQEIVARMHYLGKAKRRMFRLHAAADVPVPAPGSDIFDPQGDSQSVGKVVLARPAPEQGIDLLAEIQLSHLKDTGLALGEPTGPELTLASLPYPVTEDNKITQ